MELSWLWQNGDQKMQAQAQNKDSKVKSLAETAFDILTGFLMYIPINYFVLPLFIDTIQDQEIFGLMQISGLFTCVALVRKYTIRRWFEKRRQQHL